MIRDGMGQSQVTNQVGAVDTVITNAVVFDHWGVVKCDVGIVKGRIFRLGKAGNPDIQPGVELYGLRGDEGEALTASDIPYIYPCK